ncbi:hypothetical protein RJ639_044389 [Escallonia herrerae]|uniref:O-methyltransferase n=1 Tax=Escallonia herrerae TaxID=1293975 RepID=A0AA89B0F8_9ASTE|nr:hypothetical protein RJ639_044389 [Escallonia herrerae]
MANAEKFSELLQAQNDAIINELEFLKSPVLRCAVQLGIVDAIHNHGKPMTLSQLVTALPINPAKRGGLHSLLRMLVHFGFLDHREEGYTLAPTSRLLKDEPWNATSFIFKHLYPSLTTALNSLGDWFQNDDLTAFQTANKVSFWEYAAHEPNFGNAFNELMARGSALVADVLLSESRQVFDGLTSLVDVAGGTGTMGRAITNALPNLKCIVFDRPQVVANLDGSEKLEFIGGNMFDRIPPADGILLKMENQWILHNWSDEECLKILKKCKEAIPSKEEGGKLIIIDMVMERQSATHHFFDVLMMVLHAGKERSEKEWAQLLFDAGFSTYKITPNLGSSSTIEVYP